MRKLRLEEQAKKMATRAQRDNRSGGAQSGNKDNMIATGDWHSDDAIPYSLGSILQSRQI